MATQKSKPFVVATEGQTVDGRHISREWIEQMAKNYKPDVYTAVVNLEHFLSMHPESSFSAYGKVTALSTREAEIFGQKRLQLTAVVEASDAAVAMQREGKKCFASIEVIPNFTGLNQAYLTGLALTDTPASLGTEAMRFSAFSTGKPENVFAFPAEIEFAFDVPALASPAPSGGGQLFDKVRELLGIKGKTDEARFADQGHAIEAIALSQKKLLASQAEFSEKQAAFDAETMKKITELGAELAELKTALARTPATPNRPAAPGGNGVIKTDC
jgi:hypothetical protein